MNLCALWRSSVALAAPTGNGWRQISNRPERTRGLAASAARTARAVASRILPQACSRRGLWKFGHSPPLFTRAAVLAQEDSSAGGAQLSAGRTLRVSATVSRAACRRAF